MPLTRVQMSLRAISYFALVALAACSSQNDPVDVPITRPEVPAPAGIYEGLLQSDQQGSQPIEITAFLDADKFTSPTTNYDGHFLAFNESGSYIASGTYRKTSRTGIRWTAQVFRPCPEPVPVVIDPDSEVVPEPPIVETGCAEDELGIAVTTLTATGTFDAGEFLGMAYDESKKTAANDNGSVSLDYSDTLLNSELRYEEQSSRLALLTGTWVVENQFGIATSSFGISSDGTVFGNDGLLGLPADACNYTGGFSEIDLHYNLYKFTLEQSCGGSNKQATSGLATLIFGNPRSELPTRLISVTASDKKGIVLSLTRKLP